MLAGTVLAVAIVDEALLVVVGGGNIRRNHGQRQMSLFSDFVDLALDGYGSTSGTGRHNIGPQETPLSNDLPDDIHQTFICACLRKFTCRLQTEATIRSGTWTWLGLELRKLFGVELEQQDKKLSHRHLHT